VGEWIKNYWTTAKNDRRVMTSICVKQVCGFEFDPAKEKEFPMEGFLCTPAFY
jgi:hypothetical protein